jgi:uncharacterized membrane protein YfcA
VLAGATFGARTLVKLSNRSVRKLFVPVLALIALDMLVQGIRMLTGH